MRSQVNYQVNNGNYDMTSFVIKVVVMTEKSKLLDENWKL